MKKGKFFLFCVIMVISALLNAGSFEVIPTPKKLNLSNEKIKLKDYIIVCQENLKQAQIAADEINKRARFLGGNAFSVYEGGVPVEKLKNKKLIFIGVKRKNKLLESVKNISLDIPDSMQGYEIKMLDDCIVLAGNDSIGALYAAMTFIQLMENENGLTVKKADIKDWPDFKHRLAGGGTLSAVWKRPGVFNKKIVYGNKAPADAHYECLKEYIDWLLSQKLNLVIAFKKFMPPETCKKICQYANERGIDIFMYDVFPFQSAGLVKENKGKREYKDVRISNRHKENYITWCRDDLLTKEAEKYSKAIREGDYNYGYFESIDTGLTTLNYAEWGERTEECKKRFGNDRAAADAHVINLIYKIIRRDNPDFKFVFTVYPYSPDNVMKENFPLNLGFDMPPKYAKYAKKKLYEYYRKINSSVPKDICMLYREAMRKDVAAFRNLFPGRAFDAYFEFGKDYKPIFATNPRFSKTFFFNDDRDIIFYSFPSLIVQYSFNPIQIMLCAEYAWNTEGPDNAYFRYYIDPLKDSSEPASIMNEFLPKACETIWGKGGSNMLPLMNSGLYMRYMQNPEKLLAKIKLRLTQAKSAIEETGTLSKNKLDISPEAFINSDGIRKQYEKVKKARQSIEKLLDNNDVKMSLFARRYIVHYYKYASLWEAYSKVWLHYFKARELYEKNNIQEGDKEIAEGIKSAKAIEDTLANALKKVEGLPQLYKGFYGKRKWSRRGLLSCKQFIDKFNRLEKSKESLGKLKTLSVEDQKNLKKRNLKSFRADGKIKIDGDLSEKSWKKAKVYSSFVRFEYGGNPQTKFAMEDTEVKILNDDKNLYLGVICHTENKDGIKTKNRKYDKGFWSEKDEDDCIEIFIDSNKDKKTYFHFAANPSGARFDSRCETGKKEDSSWNSDFKAAGSIKNDKWIAEIAIPFSSLGNVQDELGVNIARQNVAGFKKEWSSISILDKNFHDVKNYSILKFKK